MQPATSPFDRVPSDLFRWFLSNYFTTAPLVVLLVLQFVSRRFRNSLLLSSKRLRDLKNTAPGHRAETLTNLAQEACREFGSSISLVRWLWKILRYQPRKEWCYGAAEGGHVLLLEWLRSDEVRCDWDSDWVYRVAARNNHRAVIEWALNHGGAKPDESVCSEA